MDPKKRDEDRISSVRDALGQKRWDAVVCSQPKHVLMLSGYWPRLGSAWAVATRDGRVLVVAPEDELDMASGGWADAVYTFRTGSLDRLESVAHAVREPLKKALGVAGAEVVGYEHAASLEPSTYASQFHFGPATLDVLRDVAPRATFTGADALLETLRVRKTRRELDAMRAVCAVAARAFEQGLRAVRPGATERVVAGAFEAAFEAGVPDDARGRAHVYCMSGPNAAEAHRAYARTRSRALAPGDVVLVHCNAVLEGYWTDLTRTYALGRNPETATRMKAIADARAAALARVRPGTPAREVDAAARGVLDSRGLGSEYRTPTGHGIGLVAIDHDEPPRIHPVSKDVLEIGMTFNVEPGLYRRGVYGMRHCDMVAVAPDGCEVLSPFQTEPEQLVLPV